MDSKEIINTINVESDNKLNKLKIFLSDTQNNLKRFSSVEISSFLYPYSSNLNSNSFKLLPFEEYIDDLHKGKRSSYKLIDDFADKFFGISLGTLIFVVFALIKPSELVSVESVISIFAAYAIGKEIWTDLDNFLINFTRQFRISWKEKKFYYSKLDFGTLQRFWELARNIRHKNKNLLPSQIDFIEHSNSKSIEMNYKKKDLRKLGSERVQILTYEFNNSDFNDVLKDSFMVAFKVVLNKSFLLFSYSKEYFWAESGGETGVIIDEKFIKGEILSRSILNISRVKVYLKSKVSRL